MCCIYFDSRNYVLNNLGGFSIRPPRGKVAASQPLGEQGDINELAELLKEMEQTVSQLRAEKQVVITHVFNLQRQVQFLESQMAHSSG